MLEAHGYPPLVLSLESIDALDHVLFAYQRRGCWGSVARSRDPGLHGRKPVFRTLRQLAWSYFDPYIDTTGCLKGYALADLRELGRPWRLADGNVWKVERFLLELPHRPMQYSARRVDRLRARYFTFRREHPGSEAGRTTTAGPGRRFQRPSSRRASAPSIQIEVAGRLADRFLRGLFERFLEPPRQGVAARAFGRH